MIKMRKYRKKYSDSNLRTVEVSLFARIKISSPRSWPYSEFKENIAILIKETISMFIWKMGFKIQTHPGQIEHEIVQGCQTETCADSYLSIDLPRKLLQNEKKPPADVKCVALLVDICVYHLTVYNFAVCSLLIKTSIISINILS